MSKRIELTQGQHTTVDDKDYDYLMKWKWYAIRSRYTFYAVRNQKKSEVKETKKLIYMHRLLLSETNTSKVDHKNLNGLDNQRSNIRLTTNI